MTLTLIKWRFAILAALLFFSSLSLAPAALALSNSCPGSEVCQSACTPGSQQTDVTSTCDDGIGDTVCCIPDTTLGTTGNTSTSNASGGSCGPNNTGTCKVSCTQIVETENTLADQTCPASSVNQGGHLLCCVPSAGSAPTQTSPTNTGTTQTNPTNTASNVTLLNPLQGGGSVETFLNNILAFVVRIGTIVVILMLVFVGFKFVAAQGEAGKLEEARSMLLWTLIGGLILLGAQAISLGIQATVNAISTGN